MSDLVWVLLLMLQAASFTWVSRARNSANILYHGVASIFSNGIFFATQFLLIHKVVNQNMAPLELFYYGFLYVLGTVTGAVLMHWTTMKYLEKGNRKVGS